MASIRLALAAALIGGISTIGAGCSGPTLSSADEIAAMNRAELEREEVVQCMVDKGETRRPDCRCVVDRIGQLVSDEALRGWLIGLRQAGVRQPVAIAAAGTGPVGIVLGESMTLCGLPG